MKFSKILAVSSLLVLMASAAQAQNLSLEREVRSLREDLQVLQRQSYREKDGGISPASAQDVAVRMGEFDETLRTTVGKIDEMEFKIKSLEEKINLINKDIDFRLKTLEGKPLNGSGMGGANNVPAAKFGTPVAAQAPKSLIGDTIATGDDLPAVKTATVDELYQQGLDAIKANDNNTAEQKFNSILIKFPNDKLAGNAQYWLGEAYYAKKDFAKAAVSFAKGYEKYKSGPKGADNILKLGMSMRELGKKAEACTAFTSLPKEFPKATEELKVKAASQATALGCGK